MPQVRAPYPIVLATASFLAYFVLLVYCDLTRPQPEGLFLQFANHQALVRSVDPGSPAAVAGVRAGDRVLSYEGVPIRTRVDWMAVQANTDLTRRQRLELVRDGERRVVQIRLEPMAAAGSAMRARFTLLVARGAQGIMLLLAILVAFRRPRDPVARIGAWLIATFGVFCVVLPSRIALLWRSLPDVVGLFLWVPFVSSLVVGALLFTFFENFPRRRFRSPLHWVAAWAPMLIAVSPHVRYSIRMVYWPDTLGQVDDHAWAMIVANLVYCAAAIVALALRYRHLGDVNERRRARVLAAGTLIGSVSGAAIVLGYWRSSSDLELFTSSWFAVGTLFLLTLPASFTYAILRHRLFDIRLILRQGVQYALARRLLLSIVPIAAAVFVLDLWLHRDEPIGALVGSHIWVYVALGALAATAHARRQRWLDALDRRFFRDRYDAQRLLRQVSDEIREAASFERAGPRVVAQIEAALHARFVALFVRSGGAGAYRVFSLAPEGTNLRDLPADAKVVALLKLLGKPLEVPLTGTGWLAERLPRSETEFLQDSQIELLVPVTVDSDVIEVVLALGSKRSEEPYTREDQDLLLTLTDGLARLIERGAMPMPAVTFGVCPACGRCFDSGVTACMEHGAVLEPSRVPRLIATRYRLDRRLGRGGMGTVYEALDTVLQRAVALKLIREDRAGHRDIVVRFQREARLAASFVHPNVVTVFDSGVTTAGQVYLVMELLEGDTLRQAIMRQGTLLPARAVAIMRAVAAAVETAHQRQLVHRDLKPENVMLVHTDGTEVPKVLDFGVAKLIAPRVPDAATTDTSAGQLIGTLLYMAPEQLRGEEVKPAWDLWALGVMAYEMIAGVHPFAGRSGTGGLVPQLELGTPFVGPPFATARGREFFARALSVDPTARPATAQEFFTEFARAFQEGAQ